MAMRVFCDNCDRDISDDDNTVVIRLDANMLAVRDGRDPLHAKHLDYCITCAKLLLPDVWSKLEDRSNADHA
jgi:hypothetical protein